jgi:branched-chain amino acid transport system ATP-binding protein
MTETGLRVSGIVVEFGGVRALDGVDIELHKSEIRGVIGPNGSGKTTLFNVMSGFVKPYEGDVHVDGRAITKESAEHRIHSGLARTFQTPRFDQEATVEHTVRAGMRSRVRGGLLASMLPSRRVAREERWINEQAREVLARFDLLQYSDNLIGELSLGLVRMVEVARAVAMQPAYLLLDEPAAGLTAHEQDVLVAQVRELVRSGIGVMIVEHNFGLLRKIATHLDVLNRGKVIARGSPDELAGNPLVIRAYLGEESADEHTELARPARIEDVGSKATAQPSAALTCTGLAVSYGKIQVCRGVDLTLERGEFLAVLGPNGAGKSSLLRGLAGLRDGNRRCHGSIEFGGTSVIGMSAASRATAGLAFVPEGRGNIFPKLTVRENLELSLRLTPSADRARNLERVHEVFPALSPLMGRPAGALSGGEQQMLAIGMALARDPAVLMLDEPTQGLAPSIRLFMADAFVRLRDAGGMGILLAEQDHDFAVRLAHRLVVMTDGTIDTSADGVDHSDRAAVSAAYLGGGGAADRAQDEA